MLHVKSQIFATFDGFLHSSSRWPQMTMFNAKRVTNVLSEYGSTLTKVGKWCAL